MSIEKTRSLSGPKEEVIAEGETVVLRCTLTGTHEGEFMGIPPTGRRNEVNESHIYRLEGGKAVEHRAGRDDLGSLRQLGVIAYAVPEPGARRAPAGEEVGA